MLEGVATGVKPPAGAATGAGSATVSPTAGGVLGCVVSVVAGVTAGAVTGTSIAVCAIALCAVMNETARGRPATMQTSAACDERETNERRASERADEMFIDITASMPKSLAGNSEQREFASKPCGPSVASLLLMQQVAGCERSSPTSHNALISTQHARPIVANLAPRAKHERATIAAIARVTTVCPHSA